MDAVTNLSQVMGQERWAGPRKEKNLEGAAAASGLHEEWAKTEQHENWFYHFGTLCVDKKDERLIHDDQKTAP
uniref:Uncharacterized protein n=1 Tax=Cannabis sativa TaxID=3483 RepID=A0A803P913_CANSA